MTLEKTVHQHWRVEEDADGILTLTLDRADRSVNALNKAIFEELANITRQIGKNANIRGVILASGKVNSFIAGADVNDFVTMSEQGTVTEAVQYGQKVFAEFEALAIPKVAAIDGFCLGGGLELALCCDYRIATELTQTKLGFPEVKLGIIPGWGGTVRASRLMGPLAAFDLILSGRQVSAQTAARMKLIDHAVPKRHLMRGAKAMLLQRPAKAQPSFWLQALQLRLLRPLLGRLLRAKVEKKAALEHYPAPYRAISNWVQHGVSADAFAGEVTAVSELMHTATSKNLVQLFLRQTASKQLSKGSDFTAERVHVIGAGVMGGDIAAWCSLRGLSVTLQDQSTDKIAQALKRAHSLFQKRLKKTHLIQAALDRLQPDVNGYGVQHADVIIEAIYENLAAKQAVFKALEQQASSEALLLSNTSSIPLKDIAAELENPERVMGLHFFNPVAQMPLIEVVRSEHTDEGLLNDALAFVHQISRTPVVVNSSPGFLVNRVLMPYMLEALQLFESGHSMQEIDATAVHFGMPMGPIELADRVGLDVCLSVAEHLSEALNLEVPQILKDKVKKGELGCKSGSGFYTYKNNQPQRNVLRQTPAVKTIRRRLMGRFLNEAAACLREGIVSTPEQLDLAMVFGTGFAPFRGGPMQYAQSLGYDVVLQELTQLEKKLGPRFAPDEYWLSTLSHQRETETLSE